MEEKLLHYIWKNKLFNFASASTVDGQKIELVDVGKHNHDSGPDFVDAKIKIGQTLWLGSVELHVKSSQWLLHKHTLDKAYDNVVLHVVYQYDVDVFNAKGGKIPTLEMQQLVDTSLIEQYQQYMNSVAEVVCQNQFASIDAFRLYSWLDRLLVERLQKRTRQIEQQLRESVNHKEEVFYHHLAKAFGFKTNADAMLLLAQSIPLSVLAKHKNSLFQLEAIFFGQAGFLDQQREDAYFKDLQKEYQYLQKKCNLQKQCDQSIWKFAKMYPSGFPSVRLAQFVALIHQSSSLLSKILEVETVNQIVDLFTVEASPYWDTHFRFDLPSKQKSKKRLGQAAVHSLIINTVLPFLFAYASWNEQQELKNKVVTFYEQLPLENNRKVRCFSVLRNDLKTALHSQALIELFDNYCTVKRCLDCGFGNHLLKKKTADN